MASNSTLASGGVVTTNFGFSDTAYSAKIQADGKILLAGSSSTNNSALARYNANGTLDTSFSGDGMLTTAIGSLFNNAKSVTVQSDGKILVAGASSTQQNAYYDFALARYNANGSLDTSFSGDGVLTTAISSYNDSGSSVLVQGDGKIVVVGTASVSLNDFALARYSVDGTLDTSFGNAGKVITDVGYPDPYYGFHVYTDESANGATLQSDGKIVVVGSGTFGSSFTAQPDFAVMRYTTAGALDTTFGSGGVVTTNFSTNNVYNDSSDYASGVAVQADGKIVVAGSSQNDFALARYNTNGTLDTSFGSSGKVTTDFSGGTDIGRSVVVQGDGKIVVAGSSSQTLLSNADIAVARYNSNGTLDTTFNGSGKVVTVGYGLGTGSGGYSVTLQLDGKIVVAGLAHEDFAVIRYNTDGSLDTGFGSSSATTAPTITLATAQTTLSAPAAGAGIAGSGLDVINMSSQSSTSYTMASNGDGSFSLGNTTTGSVNHIGGVIQVQFADKTMNIAPSNSLSAGVALLYQAALNRAPEAAGLAYWDRVVTTQPEATVLNSAAGAAKGIISIASGFTGSAEFISKYGPSLSPAQFVTQLYSNVLDRPADSGGLSYWVSQINAGVSREQILAGFAESAEGISNATVGFVGQSGAHAAWLMLV